jgi:Protein of unknown function with HXXEE motif
MSSVQGETSWTLSWVGCRQFFLSPLLPLTSARKLQQAFVVSSTRIGSWAPRTAPVTRFKGLMIDKIGLFLTLSLFAVLGVTYNWTWIFISIGIIAADVAQHLTFSAVKKSYTPGVATIILYIIYIVYFLSQRQVWAWLGEPLSWVALAVGAIASQPQYRRPRSIAWR